MGDKSNIEWTDASWNPIVGCSIVSPGCTNCYAMAMAARIDKIRLSSHYEGLTHKVNGRQVWTGKIAQAHDHIFLAPMRWRKPRRIFVNSMGDLFHESIPDEWIDRVFAVMALCPQHTFQVLTKRAERMRDYFAAVEKDDDAKSLDDHHGLESVTIDQWRAAMARKWPLSNVWLGVSCERQQEADERMPYLWRTPAAIRFVSAEPLLAPIDFSRVPSWGKGVGVDWVIIGGESGPRHRPMAETWAFSIIEQCKAAGVAVFMKQMAGKVPIPVDLMVREYP
jgi:protein gp37